VGGVGEQRQRAGEQARDDLDDHERRDDPERDRQPAAIGVEAQGVLVGPVAVTVVVSVLV